MISVIIPTYKPQEYLWDCLKSVDNQTLENKNYEVLIVLNGCNEPYLTEINDFVASNMPQTNVRILQTDEAGVSNARNIGMQQAQGDYIAFVDDDDIVSEDYLKAMDECYGADIIEANVLCFEHDIDNTYCDYLGNVYKRMSESKNQWLISNRSIFSTACCKLIKSDIIENKSFNGSFQRGEDSLFMFEISKNIKTIAYAKSSATYFRRVRNNSASRQTSPSDSYTKAQLKLIWAYTKTYFSNVLQYNILFYFSRVAASLVHIARQK